MFVANDVCMSVCMYVGLYSSDCVPSWSVSLVVCCTTACYQRRSTVQFLFLLKFSHSFYVHVAHIDLFNYYWWVSYFLVSYFQCFDAVGWATGRASSPLKTAASKPRWDIAMVAACLSWSYVVSYFDYQSLQKSSTNSVFWFTWHTQPHTQTVPFKLLVKFKCFMWIVYIGNMTIRLPLGTSL